jgi:hypothetical protein
MERLIALLLDGLVDFGFALFVIQWGFFAVLDNLDGELVGGRHITMTRSILSYAEVNTEKTFYHR